MIWSWKLREPSRDMSHEETPSADISSSLREILKRDLTKEELSLALTDWIIQQKESCFMVICNWATQEAFLQVEMAAAFLTRLSFSEEESKAKGESMFNLLKGARAIRKLRRTYSQDNARAVAAFITSLTEFRKLISIYTL